MGTNTSASISNNDGELSIDKCSQLTATRVSSAALGLPISYLSQIAHWIQVMLRDLYHLQVFVSELVGDFIKDDDDKWWFINLKSLRLTQDSFSKVQMWHAIYIKKDAAAVQQYKRVLSNKERVAKNETERGSFCNMCGLYYMPHQTTQSADGLQVIPVFGYHVTFSIARQIAKLLHARGVPSTHLTRALMKISEQGDIHLRSVKQLMYADSQGSKNILYKDQDTDKVKCCYHCYSIYQEMIKVEGKLKELHILLGVDAKKSVQKEKEEELLVTRTKSPYDMSLVNNLPPSPFDTTDHTHVSLFQSTPHSTVSHRPSSAPAAMRRKTYLNTSLLSSQLAGKAAGDEHHTEVERQLQLLVNAIKEKHISIPMGLKYATYHSIPIGVQHYRLLCMFHYVVLEEPDRVNSLLLHAQSLAKDLPKHYVVQYRFGQQEVFVPFIFDPNNQLKSWFELQKRSDYSPRTMQRKKTKLLTELTTKTKGDSNMFSKTKAAHKQNMIFIQECRLHSLVSKGQDLAEYFRDNQVPCKLYSLLLPEGSTKQVNSTPSKPSTTFMTTQAKDALPIPRQSADSLPSTSQANKPKLVQEEGEFNMYMHKLNVQGGSLGAQNNSNMSSLVEGTEKQDLLITVPTKSLGKIIRFQWMSVLHNMLLVYYM
ncbi:hypothetical protein EON65_15625 [archaeon]|nr:MAG: hypothetical protein EON65_15625 [archaeon]